MAIGPVWDHQAAGSNPVTRTKTPLKPLVLEEFLFNAGKIDVLM